MCIRDRLNTSPGYRTERILRAELLHENKNYLRSDTEDPSVHSDGEVWHLDVGSSHPGALFGPKGLAVRQLKRHEIWVQNVERQFGPYLLRA